MAVPTRMNLFAILYISMLLLVFGLQNGHSSCWQLKLLFLADVSEPSGSSRKKLWFNFNLDHKKSLGTTWMTQLIPFCFGGWGVEIQNCFFQQKFIVHHKLKWPQCEYISSKHNLIHSHAICITIGHCLAGSVSWCQIFYKISPKTPA